MADIDRWISVRPAAPSVCHPIPARQIVNHDGSIIVSSFKHALKTFRRGWEPSSPRQPTDGTRAYRSFRLRRQAGDDGGAAAAEYGSACPPPGAASPRHRTLAAPPDGRPCPSIPVARAAIAARPQARSSAGWRSCSLPAICGTRAQHANNWYHPSAESRPRRAARLFWRAVDSG